MARISLLSFNAISSMSSSAGCCVPRFHHLYVQRSSCAICDTSATLRAYEHTRSRLTTLLQSDAAPAPVIVARDEVWARVAAWLTEFERMLLQAACLYFNALSHKSDHGTANPGRALFRKAASLVLDPNQDVNDLFCDIHADVDKFWLGGTPILFISPLHLAARTGDLAMCQVLLKEGADVNINVRLLPGEHKVQEGLSGAVRLDMDAVDVVECDGNGRGYEVDFGLVTPLRLARHFNHDNVVEFLQGHSAHPGRDPATHAPSASRPGLDDAPALRDRIGVPYLGIYKWPCDRGTSVGTCLLYSRRRNDHADAHEQCPQCL